MRKVLSLRLLRVALKLADSKPNIDEFVHDIVDAHIGLLNASEDLESVMHLLERSGSQSSLNKLDNVKQKLDAALDVMRSLDHLYSSGNLFFGRRAR